MSIQQQQAETAWGEPLPDWLERVGFPCHARAPLVERIPDSGNMREIVQQYCDSLGERIERGQGLILSGPVGCGKTCALALVAAALPSGRRVRFLPVATLFGKLHRMATQPPDALRLHEISEATCDLLLLDDLGTQYSAPFALAQFLALVEQRHAERRATCISTNLSANDLERSLSLARIYDRWRELNVFVAPDATAPSQRRAVMLSDWQPTEVEAP